MALSDKNIVITPNIGSSSDDPKIVFSGADASTAGGAGATNSISGTSTVYAAGGGGASYGTSPYYSNNGNGTTTAPANQGFGGQGAETRRSINGSAGSSGVIVLKYKDTFTISNPGGGLTMSTTTSGGFKVTTITAGTGNIQWN
mgnify:CR=1 FL=1